MRSMVVAGVLGAFVAGSLMTGGVASASPSVSLSDSLAGTAATSSCPGVSLAYGGNFTSTLANGYDVLARQLYAPCVDPKSQVDPLEAGTSFYVDAEAVGEFICRGHTTYGYGTDIWFQTAQNNRYAWSWAGGTSTNRWEHDRSC